MKNILFFICCFFVLNISGQEFIKVAQFNSPLLRASNNYYKIETDQNNFFWIYTIDGILRFDGSKFEGKETLKPNKVSFEQNDSTAHCLFNEDKRCFFRNEKSNLRELTTLNDYKIQPMISSLSEMRQINELYNKCNKTIKDALEKCYAIYKTKNGIHFITHSFEFYYVDNAMKLSKINFKSNPTNSLRFISIGESIIIFNHQQLSYQVIYNGKIVCEKLINVKLLEEFLNVNHSQVFKKEVPIIVNDTLYSYFLNKNFELSKIPEGKINVDSKIYSYAYNKKTGILITSQFDGKINKYSLLKSSFENLINKRKEIVSYTNTIVGDKILTTSDVVLKYFKSNITNWYWGLTSANYLLPNKKLLYFFEDSLYFLPDKIPQKRKALTKLHDRMLSNFAIFDSLFFLNIENLALKLFNILFF